MLVMIMVAVLLSIGAPAFQGSLQRNRLQSSMNSVLSALSFARSEAVIRSEPVSMCPTVDTVSCSGSSYEEGWLVFVDNGAGSGGVASDGNLNGNEELLQIGNPAPAAITIRSINFSTSPNIVFEDSGRILQDADGTVTVCDDRGEASARAVVVQVSGQSRLAVDTDSNGIVEDNTSTLGSASDISCPS
mgnify:CR=1 FL=1